jgi:hypothetical protein
MSEPSLIALQFLAWVADRPRTYADAMEAWRSTCPHLSVWEDAIIAGHVRVSGGHRGAVTLTELGQNILTRAQADDARRRAAAPRIAAE